MSSVLHHDFSTDGQQPPSSTPLTSTMTTIEILWAVSSNKVAELTVAPELHIAELKMLLQDVVHIPVSDQLFLLPSGVDPLLDHFVLADLGLNGGGSLLLLNKPAPASVHECSLFNVCMDCWCEWEDVLWEQDSRCAGACCCWCEVAARDPPEWHVRYLLEALPTSSMAVQTVFDSCMRSGRMRAARLLCEDSRVKCTCEWGASLIDLVELDFYDAMHCPYRYLEDADYVRIPVNCWADAGLIWFRKGEQRTKKWHGEARPTVGSCKRKSRPLKTTWQDVEPGQQLRKYQRVRTQLRKRARATKLSQVDSLE